MGRDPQLGTTDTPTIIRNFLYEVRIFVTVNHIFFGINELICIFVKLVYTGHLTVKCVSGVVKVVSVMMIQVGRSEKTRYMTGL